MLNQEQDFGLQSAGPVFALHDDRDHDPLTKRIRRGNGLVIRFLKRPAPVKPPNFAADHEMVEHWRALAGRFFDSPLGYCRRMWWMDGQRFSTKPCVADDSGEVDGEGKGASE